MDGIPGSLNNRAVPAWAVLVAVAAEVTKGDVLCAGTIIADWSRIPEVDGELRLADWISMVRDRQQKIDQWRLRALAEARYSLSRSGNRRGVQKYRARKPRPTTKPPAACMPR